MFAEVVVHTDREVAITVPIEVARSQMPPELNTRRTFNPRLHAVESLITGCRGIPSKTHRRCNRVAVWVVVYGATCATLAHWVNCSFATPICRSALCLGQSMGLLLVTTGEWRFSCHIRIKQNEQTPVGSHVTRRAPCR